MALWKILGYHAGEGDSGSRRDLLSYYSVWCKALIGTCQVFGGPSGIALTLVEVMDIRKSSHCEEGGGGWVTEQGKGNRGRRNGQNLKDTKLQNSSTITE